MYLFLSQSILLLFIITLLYLLTWFLPTDSPWAPWWTTSKEKSRALCRFLKLNKKDKFYELGSGTGTTVVIAAKEFGASVVGIESSKSRVWWSKLKAKLSGKSERVLLLQKDFFSGRPLPCYCCLPLFGPTGYQKIEAKIIKRIETRDQSRQ